MPTFFTVAQRTQLRLLALVSGVVCAACALFTVITFLIDIERFEFPERAILYMSICYLFVAITYLVGGSMAKNVACSGMSSTQLPLVTQVSPLLPHSSSSTRLQGIDDNYLCSAVAFTNYYFALAGALWWFVLCFAWFLVTTLKWGEAPVGQVFGSYFTILAWGLPAVGSILILVTHVSSIKKEGESDQECSSGGGRRPLHGHVHSRQSPVRRSPPLRGHSAGCAHL